VLRITGPAITWFHVYFGLQFLKSGGKYVYTKCHTTGRNQGNRKSSPPGELLQGPESAKKNRRKNA
jgi:hypothetical protein